MQGNHRQPPSLSLLLQRRTCHGCQRCALAARRRISCSGYGRKRLPHRGHKAWVLENITQNTHKRSAISCQTVVGPWPQTDPRLSATLLVALTHGGCTISTSTEAGNHLLRRSHKTGGHPTFLRNDPLGIFVGIFLHLDTPWISLGSTQIPREEKSQKSSWNPGMTTQLSVLVTSLSSKVSMLGNSRLWP